MAKEITRTTGGHSSPFERIKRTNDAGVEFWSSREFAGVLDYGDYRNFESVIEKAKLACFNSGHRIEDHFASRKSRPNNARGSARPNRPREGKTSDSRRILLALPAIRVTIESLGTGCRGCGR